MSSPLSQFANATLTFTVYGTQLAAADSETGNVAPVTQTVEVRAFLKAGEPRQVSLPGVDRWSQTWRGYATEELDSRLQVGARGTLAIDGEVEGDCILTALRGPFGAGGIGATIKSVLGESITVERIWTA